MGLEFESPADHQEPGNPTGVTRFLHEQEEIRRIQSQHPGGVLLPPVQTLVASYIFARPGKNAAESPADHQEPGNPTGVTRFLHEQEEIRRIQSQHPGGAAIAGSEGLFPYSFALLNCDVTTPQSKIKDFCQLPLHRGAFVPHLLHRGTYGVSWAIPPIFSTKSRSAYCASAVFLL